MAESKKNVINKPQDLPLRFLVFSASLRTESLNTKLVKLAAQKLKDRGVILDMAEMKEFDCMACDHAPAPEETFPPGAIEFRKRLLANDAFVISSPEYNASMPGHIKNAIDWVSRYRPQPFNTLNGLLMSASPSMAGGNKGLWALRIPLEHLGSRVFPDMFSLASAHEAFDKDGNMINTKLATRLGDLLNSFVDLVEAVKHYPCMKKAWVEFPGEEPEPADKSIK